MPKYLVFADIHANLAAFEAVLAAVGEVDGYLYLGDVVGYGPQPRECVALLASLQPTYVMGNHDRYVLERAAPWPGGVIEDGAQWESWTAAQLDAAARNFLSSAPPVINLHLNGTEAVLSHNLPGATEYLTPEVTDETLGALLAGATASLFLFGHSHLVIDRTVASRRVINPGSVGQSRDGCPDAAYALWDETGVHLHRVPYDVQLTIAALGRLPMSPAWRSIWTRNYRLGLAEFRPEES